MAARKTKKTRSKPHYVRSKKRRGTDKVVVAQRTVVVIVIVLVVASILAGVGLGFRWAGRKLFSENPRFEIHHLEIVCDGKLGEEKIREYSGLHEGMNLFDFTFKEIREELGKVPLVESVSLERKLPSTLHVRVKERIPVARVLISNYKTPRLMDRYGVILPPRRSPELARLPLIKGLDVEMRPGDQAESRVVECALEIIALCESERYLHTNIELESLDIKYDDYIDMRLRGGSRVKIPHYSLKKKLFKLASIIEFYRAKGARIKEADLMLQSEKVPVEIY